MIDIVQLLIETLGSSKVLTGQLLQQRYCHIWKMDEPLKALAVIIPNELEDITKALQLCNEHGQEIIVHGGLTNLVGATFVEPHQIVLSLEKFNKIEDIDPISRTVTVQSGVILERLQEQLQPFKMLFPMNFGAKGSAQMGGIIASNAGGLRVLKYGMTRNLVLGLEAVTAEGTIISDLKKITKDNSGYDLKQLFIGSEGTLGIITRAVLKLIEIPKSRNSAWLGINRFDDVIKALKTLDANMGGALSGFELVWKDTYQALTGSHSSVPPTLPYDYRYYVLVETLGSHQQEDRKALETELEQLLEENIIQDGVLAYTDTDLQWFWKIREDVHTLKKQCRYDQHFDISLPIPLIEGYIEEVQEELLSWEEVEKVFVFGHLADGNIHLIVGKKTSEDSLTQRINQWVYSKIQEVNGSVSAEHGIGLDKKAYLHLCQKEENIRMMQSLKQLFDPKNILNPGRIID